MNENRETLGENLVEVTFASLSRGKTWQLSSAHVQRHVVSLCDVLRMNQRLL